MGMFRNLFDSPVHILILVLVIVIVFGWKRLPDAARSVGRSMRIFKSEVEEMKGDKGGRSAASSDTVDGDVVDDADNVDQQAKTKARPTDGGATAAGGSPQSNGGPAAPDPGGRQEASTPDSSGQQRPGA